MGEPGRHEDLAEVLLGQHGRDPLSEGRRAPADVHRDVEDLSPHRAHELSLRSSQLGVQPAQGPARGAGMVVLDERSFDAALPVLVGVEGLEEEAARIAEHDGFHEHDVR